MGGGKKDKLPFIEYLLDTADTIIVLPALAFTLLKAQGIDIGAFISCSGSYPRGSGILEKQKLHEHDSYFRSIIPWQRVSRWPS